MDTVPATEWFFFGGEILARGLICGHKRSADRTRALDGSRAGSTRYGPDNGDTAGRLRVAGGGCCFGWVLYTVIVDGVARALEAQTCEYALGRHRHRKPDPILTAPRRQV